MRLTQHLHQNWGSLFWRIRREDRRRGWVKEVDGLLLTMSFKEFLFLLNCLSPPMQCMVMEQPVITWYTKPHQKCDSKMDNWLMANISYIYFLWQTYISFLWQMLTTEEKRKFVDQVWWRYITLWKALNLNTWIQKYHRKISTIQKEFQEYVPGNLCLVVRVESYVSSDNGIKRIKSEGLVN